MHKLRLTVEDLMMGGESKQKGKTPSTLKRRRSPSPAGSGSAKASATPTSSGGAANKRKSVRPTAALGKKFKGEEDSNDLTRDMEDPPSDTNLREVEIPKTHPTPGGGNAPSAAKKDTDWLPTKGN